MKQKFRKLSFVRVGNRFTGIIDGTYSQIYGGKDIYQYAIYKIENGEVVNRISWYNENALTLLPNQDRDKAEDMIEEYNLKQ